MNAISRRRFLSASAGGLALATALRPRFVSAADKAADKVVLALIGAGGRGTALAMGFAGVPGVEFKYVCDVGTDKGVGLMRDIEKAQGRAPKRSADMREVLDDKDVHGVIIATPEHWHALGTIWACQAGKDVYVEKSVSLSIWEGRKMIEAARKYKRIVTSGFQNRSAPYAVSAREYIKSGKLGKVVHVKVYNMLNGGAWKLQPDSPVPAGLDWDRWLGPAAEVPYNVSRHRGWYDWYEYCGGAFSGDASHQLDLARMVLNDPPAPKSAYCAGGNFAFGSKRPTPEMMAITYEYGDFVMTCESCTFPPYMRKSNNEERNGTKFPYWPQNNERIEIYGTKQLMYVGRHGVGWQVMTGEGKVVEQDKGVHPDKFHQPNFVECIRSRQTPNGDIEQSHHSGLLVHLGNISYRVGNRQLDYDATAERFVGNEDANKLLKPNYRGKYRVPEQV